MANEEKQRHLWRKGGVRRREAVDPRQGERVRHKEHARRKSNGRNREGEKQGLA